MVSIRPLISYFSISLNEILGIVLCAPITYLFSIGFFLDLSQSVSTYLSFRFLWFSLYGLLGMQHVLFFNLHFVWYYDRD